MTEHTDRDALPPVAVARACCLYYIQHGAGYEPSTWEVAALLDTLDQAEADLAHYRSQVPRLAAQTEIRRRAVAIYLDRARTAEARIKAVRDVLDRHETITGERLGTHADAIRRALDGDSTNRK